MTIYPIPAAVVIPGLMYKPGLRKPITPELIMTEVCQYFDLPKHKMLSRCRKREIVFPRQLSMALIRKLCTAMSLADIGRTFNHRDHTTVLHSCKLVSDLRETDTDINNTFLILEARITDAL